MSPLHNAYGEFTGARSKSVLTEVWQERIRQDQVWGEQNHPDLPTDDPTNWVRRYYTSQAEAWKTTNAHRAEYGQLSWDGILLEEVYEALSEEDPAKRRAELIQVAAVAVAEIEAIDRRSS